MKSEKGITSEERHESKDAEERECYKDFKDSAKSKTLKQAERLLE